MFPGRPIFPPSAELRVGNAIQSASLRRTYFRKGEVMGTILLIILILLLVGVLPAWPYSSGWGYWPSGGLGLILLILIILALTGHL